MNYEIEVTVTLQVDADEPQDHDKLAKAARQAVKNALRFAESNGFEHDLAEEVSIGVFDVEVTSVD